MSESFLSFYLFLPSNVKSNKSNTQSNYLTFLPVTKHLAGRWECALVELVYPRTWHNVHGGADPKAARLQQNEIVVRKVGGKYENYFINIGNYDNITKLIEHLNESLEKTSILFKYDNITKIVTSDFNPCDVDYFILSSQLAFILGYDQIKQRIINVGNLGRKEKAKNTKEETCKEGTDKKDKSKGNNIAKYPASLDFNFNSLYVYTNVIEPSIVGDSMVQLLQICNVEGKYGDVITKNFSNPHYVPVRVKTLQSIEINIKDELGQKIPFVYGTVTVKLHFRKINPLF